MLGRLSGARGAWAQMLVITISLAIAALMPLPRGPMLLISMTGLPEGAILNRALATNARLIGAGPFSASLLVEGDRERLLPSMLPVGIIAIRAPEILCGSSARRPQ